MKPKTITLSIVSHKQAQLVNLLFHDLNSLFFDNFKVILTINCSEKEFDYSCFKFPIFIIRNSVPKGFGENHNFAYKNSNTDFFCVVNPDIRIKKFDFNVLIEPFQNESVGAVAPIILSPIGEVEDSARRFPTFYSLFKRLIFSKYRTSDYKTHSEVYNVDWVAGMFIVFRSNLFGILNGFDSEKFYMYLEDADICKRMWGLGYSVVINPKISAFHFAQRASHKNFKHFKWHIVSALKYIFF